jgi:serine protease Do
VKTGRLPAARPAGRCGAAGANALLGLDVSDLTAAAQAARPGRQRGRAHHRVKGQAARDAGLSPGMVILQVGRPVGSVEP